MSHVNISANDLRIVEIFNHNSQHRRIRRRRKFLTRLRYIKKHNKQNVEEENQHSLMDPMDMEIESVLNQMQQLVNTNKEISEYLMKEDYDIESMFLKITVLLFNLKPSLAWIGLLFTKMCVTMIIFTIPHTSAKFYKCFKDTLYNR